MDTPFVHLKVHSEYSIIDGMLRIRDLISQAKKFQMSSVALTDHVNLFALIKFYREAIHSGIKPIIGAELLIKENEQIFSFTALCKNHLGYQNLIKLISKAYLKGQNQGRAFVLREWLGDFKEGLIILSGAKGGDVGQALILGQATLVEERLAFWKKEFPHHYYLEVQRSGKAQEENYLKAALNLAEKYQIPLVATHDVRFLEKDDFEAHEARVCIQEGRVLDDPTRPKHYSEQQYFLSQEEMFALFSDIPEAIINTHEIAKRCNVEIKLDEVHLPQFPVPSHISLPEYFQTKVEAGLKNHLKKLNIENLNLIKTYQERLQIEIDVIMRMGFSGYFLIVADFIEWSKQKKIPVGPGRGSGAGSLVAYALGITALDPLEHDLLFERFLNPERVSMPDFDIDFCMEKRDLVIDYVAERYGHDSVAQIITYGTMAAKAVVRDVGRVLGMPYGFVDKIAKLIPFELGITLEKALQQEERLRLWCKEDEAVANLIALAKKLEGIVRNAGKHAGGVVIAPTRLTDFVPLYCEADGAQVVTQFDKDDVEKIGLVKFDFLGLRTLTIIDWAVQSINESLYKKNLLPIDIAEIPLDDPKTFSLLKSCATTAIFQLESRGMKDLIRRLQPDNFEDITALVALFRPGPLQSGMVDDFIARKHGLAQVEYWHPSLKSILEPTYGVILYQEQVMQIAQVLAGYSLGNADILRRAMGKKKPEEMEKQRIFFLQGAEQQNINKKLAEHIFDLMEKFAGYGFNKSHSAAYALLSYQTAWLKAHYPAEFMAAVLSSDMDNTDKVVAFIDECKLMGLNVLPPDINKSIYHFSVNLQGDIEYGLGALKGVGESVIQHLVECREIEGPFLSLFDLCKRLDLKKLTRRALEPFIKSGSFDKWGVSRASLFASIDVAIKYSEQHHLTEIVGQHDLFASTEDPALEINYIEAEPWSLFKFLQGEKEVLGFYLSGHPLMIYEKELSNLTSLKINQLTLNEKNTVLIAGMVIQQKTLLTRRGKKMGIITLEDSTGKIEVTLFHELYSKSLIFLEKESILIVKGNVTKDAFSGGLKMVAEGVTTLEKVREEGLRQLTIKISDDHSIEVLFADLNQIRATLDAGLCHLNFAYQGKAAYGEFSLNNAWEIKPTAKLIDCLTDKYGVENIIYKYSL